MLTVCSDAPFSAEASKQTSLPAAALPVSGRLKEKVPRVPLPEVAVTVPPASLRAAESNSLDWKVASKTSAVPMTLRGLVTTSNGAGLSTKIGGVTDS